MMCLAPLQILYSLATQRFSRGTLFNMVIATFMTWFVAFALLYPHHETIHFHGFAQDTLKTLPSGLAGAVGMVRSQLLHFVALLELTAQSDADWMMGCISLSIKGVL